MPALSCEPYIIQPVGAQVIVRFGNDQARLSEEILCQWYAQAQAEEGFKKQLNGRGIATLHDEQALLREFQRLDMMRDYFRQKVASIFPDVSLLWLDFYRETKTIVDTAFVVDQLATDLSPNLLDACQLFAQRVIHRKGNVWTFVTDAKDAPTTRATISSFAPPNLRMIGTNDELAKLWAAFIAGRRVQSPIQWSVSV